MKTDRSAPDRRPAPRRAGGRARRGERNPGAEVSSCRFWHWYRIGYGSCGGRREEEGGSGGLQLAVGLSQLWEQARRDAASDGFQCGGGADSLVSAVWDTAQLIYARG